MINHKRFSKLLKVLCKDFLYSSVILISTSSISKDILHLRGKLVNHLVKIFLYWSASLEPQAPIWSLHHEFCGWGKLEITSWHKAVEPPRRNSIKMWPLAILKPSSLYSMTAISPVYVCQMTAHFQHRYFTQIF